jgi:hypothetical protein
MLGSGGLEVAWAWGLSEVSPDFEHALVCAGKVVPLAVGLGFGHKQVKSFQPFEHA